MIAILKQPYRIRTALPVNENPSWILALCSVVTDTRPRRRIRAGHGERLGWRVFEAVFKNYAPSAGNKNKNDPHENLISVRDTKNLKINLTKNVIN